ncbi:MAG: hypothetical protein HQK49_17625 [Oligoflexia bacterium]|nr:hypothetical protein [Oligoflexia bacterium]
MEVGKEIIYLCPKCNLELAHIIEVTYEGKILKVMCKTCKHVHSYKQPKESRSSAQSSATSKQSKQSKVEKSIGSKKSGRKKGQMVDNTVDIEKESVGKEPKSYLMSGEYSLGDLIVHSKFGNGIVREVKQDKIMVQFKHEKKLLVHRLPAQVPKTS